jgi:hypothetical protein
LILFGQDEQDLQDEIVNLCSRKGIKLIGLARLGGMLMKQNHFRQSKHQRAKNPLAKISVKQKKQSLAATREVQRLRAAEKKRVQTIEEKRRLGVAVDLTKLSEYGPLTLPAFVGRGYYVDRPFKCKDCGKEELWTATQQKWWYEVAKGDVRSHATQCNACRRKRRERLAGERVAANLNRARQGLPPLPEKK